MPNAWTYDEAGNWLNATPDSKWVYNADNEIAGRLPTTSPGVTNITVTGKVEPEPDTTKWSNTWADCRGSRARVSLADGTFSLSNVPVDPGHNALRVTVTDVSGNTAAQVRNVAWTNGVTEYFSHDGNGNLTDWVSGSQNWTYEWDSADRLVEVSSNGVPVLQNWYDANSRRIAKLEVVGGVTNKFS
ncbi:MAG: hypothetical protein MUE94_13495 [Verrucomicrobia bacterium]|jgi:YD repeat-containing protein|nr:hypothetical protein [Verrucomicrobiota bacterium]